MLKNFIPVAAKVVGCVALLSGIRSYAIDGPLTPDQAISTFTLDKGLKAECVASEPMVVSPVAVAWDESGKMYVVEDRGYPVGPGKGKKAEGQVVLLQDTKGDGKYDKRTVFVDGLTFPNGVMPWKGGVYVTCAPYLYYFKDTNSDGVADIKEKVFVGFQDLSTTQLRVSHPTLNIDNMIYLTSGLTSAKVKSPKHPERGEVFLNRTDGRFNPLTEEFEPTAGMAQFGQTFDPFGHKFICMNRQHIAHVVLQNKYVKRNPDFACPEIVQDIPDHGAACRVYAKSANITTFSGHAGYITSACAVTMYHGTALPPEYDGNTFTCEPAGNLVHRDIVTSSNATFRASRAAEGVEFLASPDNWFRAVDLAIGPDGALYVCDMYRKTIEHPDYLPEGARKIADFVSGKDKGRLYRITAANMTETQLNAFHRRPNFDKMSVKEICNEFNNPNAWWRTTAQRLLLERQDKSAEPYLRAILKNGKMSESRVLALRMLDGLGLLKDSDVEHALADKDANMREQGLQFAEVRVAKSSKLLSKMIKLADDPNARVRFQCALSIGEANDEKIIPALAKIAEHDINDKWARAAVLTSVDHHSDKLLHALLAQKSQDSEGRSQMIVDLCKIVGTSDQPETLVALLEQMTTSTADADFGWQQSAVNGIAEGLRSRGGQNSLMGLFVSGTNDKTKQRVESLLQRAAIFAHDGTKPLHERAVSINLLSYADYSTVGPTLIKLLDPQQPSEVRLAAVRALGQMGSEDAVTKMVSKDHWASYTPAIRDAAVNSVIAKTNLLNLLFTAIENGDVPAWTVNGDRRGQLMHSKDEATSKRAVAIFKNMNVGDRMKVYEEYKSILSLKRNPKNGHAVFQRTCTPCHIYAGEGHVVGPDLTGIRNQPDDVLLLHIVIPEYEIMPIYTLYNVETKDGEPVSGLLTADTPTSITLRQAGGVEQQIARSNIASMASSRLSLMPQELEKTMTKQDLADLIGFLKAEEPTENAAAK